MTGKQWNNWSRSSSKAKGWDPKSSKSKGSGKGQAEKGGLPAYDATSLPSSTASSSRNVVDKTKDCDLKQALKEFISQNDFEVPAALQNFIQQEKEQDLGHTLKEDQRALNHKRKLAQRLERLKLAQQRKEEQWLQFREDMKNHLLQEKERYEKECKEITKAIADTQTELDKALSGVIETAEMETEIPDEDLAEILQCTEKAKEINTKQDMNEVIKQAHEGHILLAKQLGDLQAQMHYMATMIQAPAVLSPSRSTLAEALAEGGTPTKRKSALEPFARRARDVGPYNTPEKVEDKEKMKLNLNGLDGYGPSAWARLHKDKPGIGST